MKDIIWTPQPRQALFQSRGEDEALYGGAAGGGKSDALLTEALRQVRKSNYRALILRKTYPQLSELIDRSRELYMSAFKDAKYNDSKHVWTFKSGAKIYFGAMQHTTDRINYQGKRYDFIGFDELTHFTWDEYSYMFSRNRPSGPGTRVYIRATTNPGGVGHGWVKERFITAAPPEQTIWESRTVFDPNGKALNCLMSRVFIPSSVFDNRKLLENDPNYIYRLDALPEKEKKALLYGDWDSFSGQVFTEWKDDAQHYEDRKSTHVIAPFIIPSTWRILRSFDWGYKKPFSVGWYAVDHEDRLYRIREFYGCNGTPDVGIEMNAKEIAKNIKEIEANDPNLKEKKIRGVCDPAVFQEDGGESTAEIMEKCGVYWDKADNSRISGKMQIHYRMSFDDENKPKLYVFNTCKHFIRTIPNLVYSETQVEDVNTKQEDHIYDELRYVCMENPINPPINKKGRGKEFDPLSIDNEYIPYSFGMKYL